MTNAEKRRMTILCLHDFQPADDLPADKWRCVKCADNGIYDSIQTQNLSPATELAMRLIHRNAVMNDYRNRELDSWGSE